MATTIPNLWEYQTAIKALYSRCVEPVCEQYGITRMELDILLFLSNNPRLDTAADIVAHRHLCKSQVSTSLRLMEQRGLISKSYTENNRKSVHLSCLPEAVGMIRDGKAAQSHFFRILFQDFTEEELGALKMSIDKIKNNLYAYLKA